MSRIWHPVQRKGFLAFLVCMVLSLVLLWLPLAVRIRIADRLHGVLVEPFHKVVAYTDGLRNVKRENEELRARLLELQFQVAAERRRREGNQAPPRVGPARVGTQTSRLQPCEVIGRRWGRFVQMIKIRSAKALRWRRYQPVVTETGLLGRIISVTSPRSAWVQLLSSPDMAVGCELERTGLLGVLRHGARGFVLDMIGRDEDVRVGDRLITSGIAEIKGGGEAVDFELMPRGLPVGRVSEVASPPAELFKLVLVEPFASGKFNETVFVVGADSMAADTEPLAAGRGSSP